MTWAEVQADGLQVTLSGIAPTEAIRFHALTTAGSIVDAARVIDEMEVEAQAAIAPPRFSAEVLRNDSGISIIGLVPTSTDRAATVKRFTKVAGDAEVTDLLEAADYPCPARLGRSIGLCDQRHCPIAPRQGVSRGRSCVDHRHFRQPGGQSRNRGQAAPCRAAKFDPGLGHRRAAPGDHAFCPALWH